MYTKYPTMTLDHYLHRSAAVLPAGIK